MFLTFNSKSSQIAKTFLRPLSQAFGLACLPLNSATLSCSSEVTLESRIAVEMTFQPLPLNLIQATLKQHSVSKINTVFQCYEKRKAYSFQTVKKQGKHPEEASSFSKKKKLSAVVLSLKSLLHKVQRADLRCDVTSIRLRLLEP